jgi:hypothetical protein
MAPHINIEVIETDEDEDGFFNLSVILEGTGDSRSVGINVSNASTYLATYSQLLALSYCFSVQ